MHPINKLLISYGLQISIKRNKIPKEFMADYNKQLTQLRRNPRGFNIFRKLCYETGVHPTTYVDHECAFASYHISRLNPKNVLDIGSYRHFILGMLSHFKVTTVDVRGRAPISNNEVIVTCDAKKLNLPDNEFDVVISLCALEHFGLGRYGDKFDFNADKKAFEEMIRVLKPNGRLVFTTQLTRGKPSIAFNAGKVYDYEILRKFCDNLICEDEKFYSSKTGDFCSLEEVTTEPNKWDVYCGCWKKRRDAS